MPSDFESSIKEFITCKIVSMLCLKKKCSKLMIWLGTLIDFRLMLILSNLDLLLLSMISMSLMRISIDECKERPARMRAKKDCFVKACSSSFHDKNMKI